PYQDCNKLVGDGCEVNIAGNARNCGGCGVSCAGNHVPTPTCGNRICNGACEPGFSDCNGDKLADGCETNTAVDVSNCGACNRVCSSAHGTASCAGGACQIACDPLFGDCDKDPMNGCERALRTV